MLFFILFGIFVIILSIKEWIEFEKIMQEKEDKMIRLGRWKRN